MQLKKSFRMMVLLSLTMVISACGGGGSSGGGTGTVSLSLTDSTTDQYRGVYITIVDLQICSNNGESSDNGCWRSLDPPDGTQFPQTYNLLRLVNGVTEAIGSGEFSAGEYNQVRLIIGNSPELENNLLGEPHPEANYVILNDGNTIESLKIPSGLQTGLKLVHPFTVGAQEIKELVLDFDAGRSVVKAGNSGTYILKPTIKVIEPEDKVEINGTVTDDSDPANPIGGALVSAQISDGLSATVVRSTTTAIEETNEGEYILSLLSPDQTYNIVAYSDGKSPACMAFRYNDPDDEYPELPLNFALSVPDSGFVTVTGKVSVEEVIAEDFPLVITIYTELECNHPNGEGYVELTEVADVDITYDQAENVFNYQIDLPKYDSSVTYYVVASSEGYVPDTVVAEIDQEDTEITMEQLVLGLGE